MNKKIIALVLAVLIGGAIVGAYYFPVTEATGSPAGTTFNTAKVATVAMAPASDSGTSTALYNSDLSDRYIQSWEVGCTGIGTSQAFTVGTGLPSGGWQVTFSTSSSATQTAPNANAVIVPIATTTGTHYNMLAVSATTTPAISRIWGAGTYLQPTFNATNTASCVVGVNYLAS